MRATAYCIDPAGWLVSTLYFDDEAARDAALAERADLVAGIAPPESPAPGMRPRRVGSAWMALPWPPAPGLSERRARLLDRAQAERDRRIFGGFTWDGSRFDSDAAVSQPRILGLKGDAIDPDSDFDPAGEPWRLADNTWRVLSRADAIAVYRAMRAHIRNHFGAFAVLEAQIHAASDADLSTIDPTQGFDVLLMEMQP